MSEESTRPFVVRRQRWETTSFILYAGVVVFALMLLLTLGCVVVAWARDESPRGPLEAVWLSFGGMPLIFAVGLPVLLGVGFVTTAEARRESGDEDVLLMIEDDGVYLGGDRPQRLPWSDVHGICRVERRDVDGDGEETWHAHVVVLRHPDSALPKLSKNWGPSCDWPEGLLAKHLTFEELTAAVHEHAPHVAVTDRGRVLD
ncbi:hypothetical protein [Kribbella amoyensis]|nr:hypothetical protein [Kribbella amoyensis]